MKCYKCQYYSQTATWNRCSLTESECFHTDDNCTLVNDDGSINYEDEYFKDMKYEFDDLEDAEAIDIAIEAIEGWYEM